MGDFGNCEDFLKTSTHNKTIVHIDIDCFYAQVEVLKNPSLCNKPVGIKQKNYVITSNYIARAYGIGKCMFVSEALQLCPSLILINGENLHDYKHVSSDVTSIVKTFSDKVEKLGLDENFIDVTDIVYKRMNISSGECNIVGHIYNNVIETECSCGCAERIAVGSVIAKEIRDKIKEQIGLTSCAGISYNKLLAKLVTSANKPDQQTVIFPSSALNLMQNLGTVGKIPGVGIKTCDVLNSIGISSITDLQNYPLIVLQKQLLKSSAVKLKKASFGIDDDDVKPSGKPQSISVEDACKKVSSIQEIKVKLNSLVQRLIVLIKEDGRQPTTARATVRKYKQCDRQQIRESKQCFVNAEWFIKPEYSVEKIVKVFLDLFQKLVDVSKPFHLTLISIAVTKFLDKASPKRSISVFFQKTNISQVSEDIKEKIIISQEFEKPRESSALCEESNNQVLASSSRHKSLTSNHEVDKTLFEGIECPKGIDEKVFSELPSDIQDELIVCSKCHVLCGSKVTGTIVNEATGMPQENVFIGSNLKQMVTSSIKQCPPGIDKQVFSQLPTDIQHEIIVNSAACHKKTFKKEKQNSIERYFSKFVEDSGNFKCQ